MLAVCAGCAAPGAPQPPSLRVPVAVDNLSATRKGDRVILTWSPPTETTDRQTLRWPTTTIVCRALNQFPTNVCGEVVKQLKSTELTPTAVGGRKATVTFEDVLPPSLIEPQNQATYAVEVVTQHSHSAGLSNQVRVSLAPTQAPPADFRATLDKQGPLLEWSIASMLPPAPGVSYRLRIYRRTSGKREFALAGEEPFRLGESEARDHNFEWEQKYDYKITPVTVLTAAGKPPVEVEGNDSEVVHLNVHDIFPPEVPTGLQAVYSSVGQKPFIDLTWAPNTESDLAGYIVYRRSAESSAYVVASSGTLKAPAWRDTDVRPGEKYFYTVAAVDARGNQSAQSAPATESVPLEVR